MLLYLPCHRVKNWLSCRFLCTLTKRIWPCHTRSTDAGHISGLFGSGSSFLSESLMQKVDCLTPRVALSKIDMRFSCMRHNYSRRHDDMFNHRAESPSLHRAFHRDVSQLKCGLPDYPENVVCKLYQFKYKLICIKLAGGELLGTKVCFDLAVILLHLAYHIQPLGQDTSVHHDRRCVR